MARVALVIGVAQERGLLDARGAVVPVQNTRV